MKVLIRCLAPLSLLSFSPAQAFLVRQNNPASIPIPMRTKLRQADIHRSQYVNLNIPRGGTQKGGHTNVNRTRLQMTPGALSHAFDNAPFIKSSLIFTAANTLGLLFSLFTKSQLHVDLLGTGAFALASLPALLDPTSSTRVTVSSGAVFVWASKLTSFLLFRILKVKSDARLDGNFETVGGTTLFWFVSLLWGLFCSLPHTIGTTSTIPGSPTTLAIGATVYALGLATESMADYQKWQFKSANPSQFCNEGLWSVTQHPNFFGNLLLWSGILIMNSDSLIEPMTVESSQGILSTAWAAIWSTRRLLVAFASPLFMWALFKGQADGSVTNSLELATKKYGSDPAYQEYVKSVPLLVPNIFAWLKALISGR
eukprot:CAMPEP_0197253248 /NCGR_PEP_ID=MMETSP1429-20130617/64316_1 /TAXON_ID=49237 /ORGANISM="Chaetoceros  sp., Strain UNC1202" /LENGTH=369 /DNA_ID=CAMNT_0042715855 /DNA_START=6 /DNA_END=1115 /DNA_ORIENTATION=-